MDRTGTAGAISVITTPGIIPTAMPGSMILGITALGGAIMATTIPIITMAGATTAGTTTIHTTIPISGTIIPTTVTG